MDRKTELSLLDELIALKHAKRPFLDETQRVDPGHQLRARGALRRRARNDTEIGRAHV